MKIKFKKGRSGQILHTEEVKKVVITIDNYEYRLTVNNEGDLVINKTDLDNLSTAINTKPSYANQITIN